MIFLGILSITLTIIGVMAWMSPESDEPKKPWKPKKKNWFVRMGEGHHGPMGPVGGWS